MQLPSIKSLEAFEAAVKHLNFTRAAEELHLSSAAISQRISALEDVLAFALFERKGPKLELTKMGEVSHPILIRSITQVRTAIGSLNEITQNKVHTIKVSPSFAQKWLTPKLGDMNLRHPNIDLRVWSTTNRVRLENEEFCSAIYYSIDPTKRLSSSLAIESLFEERVFPVCSPEYAERMAGALEDRDFSKLTLIHDDTMKPMQTFPDWRRWCDTFSLRNVDTSHGPRFIVSSIAIQSAIEGQGLALARGALARDDLRDGRLVRPISDVYPLKFPYFFVYPKIMAQQDNFLTFRDWLLEQSTQHNDEYCT